MFVSIGAVWPPAIPTPGTGCSPLGGIEGGGAPLAIGTNMLSLAAIVRTVVRLAMIVGVRDADDRIMGPVGNGASESTPFDGRFVLMD